MLEGNNVGLLNWSRLKKLMQSENMRAQVISQLSPQENTTVLDDYIEDAVRHYTLLSLILCFISFVLLDFQ